MSFLVYVIWCASVLLRSKIGTLRRSLRATEDPTEGTMIMAALTLQARMVTMVANHVSLRQKMVALATVVLTMMTTPRQQLQPLPPRH